VQKSRIRGGLRARWQALFQEVDVVLCPVMPTPAFPHDHSPQRSRQLDVDGKKIPYNDQLAWMGIATLTGCSAARQDASTISPRLGGGYRPFRTRQPP
jgi:amidase